jgi:hypothetical protein
MMSSEVEATQKEIPSMDSTAKNIYIICSVANGTPPEVEAYVAQLEAEGHHVHFPPRDVEQNDPTGGWDICNAHGAFMRIADRVDVFYDENSGGSKFDLGMAFILDKPMKLVAVYNEKVDAPKSYLKMLRRYIQEHPTD